MTASSLGVTALHALGLGACWCGYAMMAAAYEPAVARAMGAPEGRGVLACLMAGRPRLRFRRIPPRPEPDVTWLD